MSGAAMCASFCVLCAPSVVSVEQALTLFRDSRSLDVAIVAVLVSAAHCRQALESWVDILGVAVEGTNRDRAHCTVLLNSTTGRHFGMGDVFFVGRRESIFEAKIVKNELFADKTNSLTPSDQLR